MKKILIVPCIILILPLIFKLNVKASSDITSEQFRQYFDEYFDVQNYTCTDYAIGKYLDYESGSMYAVVLKEPSNQRFDLFYFDGYTINGNYLTSHGTDAYLSGDAISGQMQTGYNSGYMVNVRNAIIFQNKQEMIDTISDSGIDFDNVYYSPLIATPILNPYYTAYNESGINIPYVPLTFNLSNSSEDYYLQIKQKNYTPSVVRVEGSNKFNVQARNGFEIHDVYEMQDMVLSSDFVRNDFYDAISDNWTNDLNEFAFSNVQMINGLESTIGSTADAYFLAQTSKFQQLRNIQTVYGNIIEIWARYFMIDENNNVVVGKWYHWWSLASDSFDEQLPEYVIPYEKAYGTENTTDQNNAPNGVGTTNGTGTSSNPNQNYTYVSVVPNYPDYPTIASYNKDNLLVDTITKMNDTKVFFGEFNNFLEASFVWVPSWIWGIIGVGFALSIIVFFLRML